MSHFFGQTLGERYRIVSLLGSGGMGDVYLAEHVLLGKRMAVKVLKPELSRDEDLVQRFQQEAIAASRIGQENIVSVTDFGRTPEGAFYFVMEALAGEDLGALLRRVVALPLERALPLLAQVARALCAAHAEGIVHRDLKAENVMVLARDDGTDWVKVLDFGISKMSDAASASNPRLTQAGVLMGTPNYMAPEQARGEPVDARSDVYSFGILIYEVLTGTLPFQAPTLTAVLLKQMTEAPEPPSLRRPELGLPPELEATIMRTLEKDPARRPQTMAEVRDSLVRVMQQLRGGVLPLSKPLAPRSPEMGAVGGLERTYVSKSHPPPTRRAGRAVVWVLGVAFLLGLGAVAVVKFHPRPTPALGPPANWVPLAPAPAPEVLKATREAPVKAPPEMPTPTAMPTPTPLAAAHRLSEGDVQRVFSRSSRKLKDCLYQNRDALPGAAGSISVSFIVLKSGMVKEAKLLNASAGGSGGPLESCVTKTVKAMRFPPHSEAAVAFEIPLGYDFKN